MLLQLLVKCARNVSGNCSVLPSRHLSKYMNKKSSRIERKRLLRSVKSMEMSILAPPKSVRGLTVLERDKIKKTIKLPRLDIGADNQVSNVLPYIKAYLLKMENLKAIQNNSALLNPLLIKNWSDIEVKNRENLQSLGITERQLKLEDFTLTYENWKSDEIFKAVLPTDKDGLSSFSKVGHIVHVNLKDHLLPYKSLVGQVLLDKVKDCKTVVNKTENISSMYRFFKMELLAGEDNMNCVVKENHCRFQFDFSTVYWNPRLCTEHERIANIVEKDDVVYDVFAGVGPFAIPCAKKKAVVLANDLNPDSYKWLNHNRKLNKINEECLITYNKDGRDFISNDLRSDLTNRILNELIGDHNKVHVIMNLPQSSVEFLDIFSKFLSEFIKENNLKIKSQYLPIIHCYCFVKGDDLKNLAKELVETHLGHKLKSYEVFNVRNVSPKKDMMRVSFRLTQEIVGEEKMKKRRVEPSADSDSKKCVVWTMGKNKQSKTKKGKNVFQVSSVKSNKLKVKAKMAKMHKKTNNMTRKQVAKIDKQLESFQKQLRQPIEAQSKPRFPRLNETPARTDKKPISDENLKRVTSDNLSKINSMSI